jgi:desulfoferrodoxin (superoxide reductase-like protein)
MSSQTRREFFARVGAVAAGAVVLPAFVGGIGAGCGDDGGGGTDVNEAWEALAVTAEGTMIYDASTPWSDGTAKAGSHVPAVALDGTAAIVTTPHSLDSGHYITMIYLRDQDGVIVALEEFSAPSTEAESQIASFSVPAHVTSVTAYSHCNQHDVWRSASISVTAS